MGLFSNDGYIRCGIINDETFEIINTDFSDIRNGSIADNIYQFGAKLPDDIPVWKPVILDKNTGKIKRIA